jgi:hypothetical protein
MWNHILPFKGRLDSGVTDLNLLMNNENVYLMDNHLAASWCWMRHLDSSCRYNLFHIDRHYDFFDTELDTIVKTLDGLSFNFQAVNIEDLLQIMYNRSDNNIEVQAFIWNNYIDILLEYYPKLIKYAAFATHKEGTRHKIIDIEYDAYELPLNLEYWINIEQTRKWIINIDMDYFFTKDLNDNRFRFLSDGYISQIAENIKKVKNKTEVLTIALSPECCGGWSQSEAAAKVFIESLGLDFPQF